MAKYEFTSLDKTTVTLDDGSKVKLSPDKPYTTDDPCQITDLVVAWQDRMKGQGESPGFSENEEGAFNEARQACAAQIVANVKDALATLNLASGPGPDPSTQDGPPPGGN